MANLIRSAKSGSNWTLYDLKSYHISLNQMKPLPFFGLQELPTVAGDCDPVQRDNFSLDMSMIPKMGQNDVIQLAIWLFESLGYSYRERVARRRVGIKVDTPLFICGETRNTRAGICIVDRNDCILLLVQPEAKRLENMVPINVHAQLVVKAIAAFNENNRRREAVGLPPLVEKVMPGIVMLRTFPVFFKIPVTETLSTHIRHGTYPPEETRVMYCYPHLPLPARRRSEAMKLPDNRREILRCYEAFKSIVGI